jgi:quinol monooxygenase YgiN
MVVLTAYATLLPEQVSQALEACRTVRRHSVLEPGCERYDFFQSPDDPTRITFVEEWTSKAALDTHFQQPAFNEFFAALGPLLRSQPEIRIFESTLYPSPSPEE